MTEYTPEFMYLSNRLAEIDRDDPEFGDVFGRWFDAAPPEIKNRVREKFQEISGLKPTHFDEHGVPHYSAKAAAEALGMSQEELEAEAIEIAHETGIEATTDASRLRRVQ